MKKKTLNYITEKEIQQALIIQKRKELKKKLVDIETLSTKMTVEELKSKLGEAIVPYPKPITKETLEAMVNRPLVVGDVKTGFNAHKKADRQFDIYHSIDVGKIFTEEPTQRRLFVGTVMAISVGEAWLKSQNFSSHWNKKRPCRSTSVGDVIRDGNELHLVKGIGFELIGHVYDEEYGD